MAYGFPLMQPGDVVRTRAIYPPAYQLPAGLPDGVDVTLKEFSPGYWNVEYQGKIFRLSMTLLEARWWFDERFGKLQWVDRFTGEYGDPPPEIKRRHGRYRSK